ncbi:MAG: LysR family transcriptional regulator [Eubacteriales bacterium]|nr:LysR family transcriptional regulator [Eubacteriales bacterium]
MDLKQLNTFLKVSNLLNFTKAAERLGYAQSSVTAQIQQLENELGVALFERIGKKVMLTDSGRRLIPYATQILQLSNNMRDAVSNSEVPTGSLAIGTAESLSIYRLSAILKEYRRLYPEVDVELKLLNCFESLPNLTTGAIDIAFIIGNRVETKNVRQILELKERIQVLASPDHPLTEKKRIIPEDFEKEALLLTGRDCSYRGAFMKRLVDANVVSRIVLETDSIQVIKQSAMSGLGICVLPEVSVLQEVSEGRLIPLKFDTRDFMIVSQLLYHKDKWISSALSEFIKLSKQILEQR